jgi:hypothetical protein
MRAIGIAIPFFRRRSGVPIDAQAQAHFNRVIADGGVVPSGLSGVNAFFSAVKAIYGTSDINTAISAAYDAHYLGYKLGAGSGTTLGQAAQKMYAPKGIFGGIGTGSAFWEGVGVAGNFVSTASRASLGSTQLEIIVDFAGGNPNTTRTIFSQDSGSGEGRIFSLEWANASTGTISLFYNPSFSGFQTSSVGVGNIANYNGFIKVTYLSNGTNATITFFSSTDRINWTTLSTHNVVSARLGNGNGSVQVGANNGANLYIGNIKRATVSNTINGTPVVDFNANQYTGANTWTSTTSEVWTVNSTGAGLADVTQTTAASQPLLLAHTGENYWFSPRITGNTITTPRTISTGYNAPFEIEAKVKFQDLTGTFNYPNIFSVGENYALGLGATNGQLFTLFAGGNTAQTTNTIASNFDGYVRLVRVGSSYTYYTSLDGINWTLLEVVAGTTAPYVLSGTNTTIGNYGTFDNRGQFNGNIYRARLWINGNRSTGTLSFDFNPASYNPSVSQTQWTSATGEIWSVNTGTATTGYKSALVTKSIVQGDGVDDTLIRSTLPSIQYFSQYVALNPLTIIPSGGEYYVDGGGARGLIYGNSGQVRAWNGSEIQFTGANDNRLNLYNANYNGVSSTAYKNNALNGSGNTGTNISNMISLFSNGSGGSFSNSIINTIVKSLTVDNTTVNTAMYNALRGFDNNAY